MGYWVWGVHNNIIRASAWDLDRDWGGGGEKQ
jgi:hypothetical protein